MTSTVALVLSSLLCSCSLVYGDGPTCDLGMRFQDDNIVSEQLRVEHTWVAQPSAMNFLNNGVYASTAWKFENGVSAYVGSQAFLGFTGESTDFMFSVWDKNSYMKPVGTGCGGFGGEGTGTKCMKYVPVRPNVKYTLEVKVLSTTAAGQTWRATYSGGGQYGIIGDIFLRNDAGLRGWGRIKGFGIGSFYETFKHSFPCSTTPYSSVVMTGPFLSVSGRDVAPMSVVPSWRTSCTNADCRGIGSQKTIVCSGGGNTRRIHAGNLWQQLEDSNASFANMTRDSLALTMGESPQTFGTAVDVMVV